MKLITVKSEGRRYHKELTAKILHVVHRGVVILQISLKVLEKRVLIEAIS